MTTPTKTAGTAALYHRVSTIDQDASLARGELAAVAAARGLVVALDVEETGSGARNDRPGLRRVLDAARRGQVGTVIVWKLDRFGRSALDLLANIRQLEDAGVRFVAASQGIDIRPGGDPMSRLLLTMLAGVAEFERALIVERTQLGLAKARREGKQLGRRVGARKGGAKAPPGERGHAPDGPAVAQLRLQGLSWAQVAARLGCSPSAAQRAAQRVEAAPAADPPDPPYDPRGKFVYSSHDQFGWIPGPDHGPLTGPDPQLAAATRKGTPPLRG